MTAPPPAAGPPALQHLAVDAIAPQPWRNGGGHTRELFTWPGGGAPWQLRLSVADIAADGPFSAYPGVDRWFAVLQGDGVQLDLPGAPGRVLTRHSPPLAFPGEAAPGCRLQAGATRDLNLMLRRGAGLALLQDATPGQPWQHGAALRGLFTTAALRLQTGVDTPLAVAAWTLVLALHADPRPWQLPDPLPAGARACWLAFQPAPAPGLP